MRICNAASSPIQANARDRQQRQNQLGLLQFDSNSAATNSVLLEELHDFRLLLGAAFPFQHLVVHFQDLTLVDLTSTLLLAAYDPSLVALHSKPIISLMPRPDI